MSLCWPTDLWPELEYASEQQRTSMLTLTQTKVSVQIVALGAPHLLPWGNTVREFDAYIYISSKNNKMVAHDPANIYT